jgi:hypothetical protein
MFFFLVEWASVPFVYCFLPRYWLQPQRQTSTPILLLLISPPLQTVLKLQAGIWNQFRSSGKSFSFGTLAPSPSRYHIMPENIRVSFPSGVCMDLLKWWLIWASNKCIVNHSWKKPSQRFFILFDFLFQLYQFSLSPLSNQFWFSGWLDYRSV